MSREKTIEVPESILKNIIGYCEKRDITDKLGAYGDFYYKLKDMIKEETVSDELRKHLMQIFMITDEKEVPYVVIGIAAKYSDGDMGFNHVEYDNLFDYGDVNDAIIGITEKNWRQSDIDDWVKKMMKSTKPYAYKHKDVFRVLKKGETIRKAVDRNFKIFEFISKD